MTTVSCKEFVSNQDKYFELAVLEDIRIKRGKDLYRLIHDPIEEQVIRERVYYEPDEEFYESISMEEVREGVLKYIAELDKKYATK